MPPRSDVLVIELCGLPGIGKTSLARELVDHLLGSGVPVTVADATVSAAMPLGRRLLHKAAMVAPTLKRAPARELRAAALLSSGQRSVRDSVAVTTHWWVREHVLRTARRGAGVVLVEEGLVQALWSAGLWQRTPDVPRMVSLATSSARPDLVVHLDAPVELALERLRGRPSQHSRIQRLPQQDQESAMRLGDVLLRELLTEWGRRRLSDVLTVDARPASC